MVFDGYAGVFRDFGVRYDAVHVLQGVHPGIYFGLFGAVAGYGFEGVGDNAADVIGHDILAEAAFCAGVDYHRAQPGAPRKWAAFPAKDWSNRIVVILV